MFWNEKSMKWLEPRNAWCLHEICYCSLYLIDRRIADMRSNISILAFGRRGPYRGQTWNVHPISLTMPTAHPTSAVIRCYWRGVAIYWVSPAAHEMWLEWCLAMISGRKSIYFKLFQIYIILLLYSFNYWPGTIQLMTNIRIIVHNILTLNSKHL